MVGVMESVGAAQQKEEVPKYIAEKTKGVSGNVSMIEWIFLIVPFYWTQKMIDCDYSSIGNVS